MPPASPPDDIVAAIRHRPGMYIGQTGEQGIEHLIFELVANSLDQFLGGEATQIRVSVEADDIITVSDDGPGLPYDLQHPSRSSLTESWLTQLHDAPTADGHSPHVHLNPQGRGLVIVAALSRSMRIRTHHAGKRWQQDFCDGKPVAAPIGSPSKGRGTDISFRPESTVLQSTVPRWSSVRHRLFECAHLYPGVRLGCREEWFHAPSGLADLAEFEAARLAASITDEVKPRKFHLITESEGIRMELAATGNASHCAWQSWCNGARTIGHGTHVHGFRDALRSAKWMPATALIHVVFSHPQFAGPVRHKLVASHVRKAVRDIANQRLKAEGR